MVRPNRDWVKNRIKDILGILDQKKLKKTWKNLDFNGIQKIKTERFKKIHTIDTGSG